MMTLQFAREIAIDEIAKIIRESVELRKCEFLAVTFLYDDEQTWTFAAASPQLQEEGFIPGAIFATVDKKDGHLWNLDEQAQFHQTMAEAKKLQIA